MSHSIHHIMLDGQTKKTLKKSFFFEELNVSLKTTKKCP